MVDIHDHILFGVDDGAENLEMTINMLRIASEEGIEDIIATPHYIYGGIYDKDKIIDRFQEVRGIISAYGFNINLYLGNELYIDDNLDSMLKKGECFTLANSDYILVELPIYDVPEYTNRILFNLKLHGYKPIIAHPETCINVQHNPNMIIEWIEKGYGIQVNTTSIIGKSGNTIRQLVKLMIKHNMVHFVATDAHTDRTRSPRFSDSYDQIVQWASKDTAKQLCETNPSLLLSNEPFVIGMPRKINISQENSTSLFRRFNMVNL